MNYEEEYKKLAAMTNQLEKKYKYYETQTLEYKLLKSEKKRESRFQMFSIHINELNRPKNHVEFLLRNFYFYVVQYLDINQLREDYTRLEKENILLKEEIRLLKKESKMLKKVITNNPRNT